LKIAFNQIESSPGQAAATGCTSLDLFESRAVPAMGMPVDVLPDDGTDAGDASTLGKSSCLGCHGKDPGPDDAPGPAVQAMNLRAVTSDPAAACAEAKRWIDTKERSNSVILLNPTGKGNALHPMKPVASDDPIIAGIKAWVDAEQ
jgi:mono/diheme cytochrome c family protein